MNGYGTMVGGDVEAVKPLEPIFKSLAPADGGYIHCGPPGAGHYTKMVHNGIEYGLMQAYAEGFEIMHASEYPLDLEAIAKAWMHGTVIRSWLLELAGLAFEQNGTDLADIKGWVADSGEGRWTVQDAIDHDVPAPIITLVAAGALPQPPGRELLGEGARRAAQPVRRARGQERVTADQYAAPDPDVAAAPSAARRPRRARPRARPTRCRSRSTSTARPQQETHRRQSAAPGLRLETDAPNPASSSSSAPPAT